MKPLVYKPTRNDIVNLISQPNSDVLEEDRDKLSRCIYASETVWLGKVDKKLVCVWGLIPPTLLSDRAYLWLYATDKIKEHEFVFVRKSQLFVQETLRHYSELFGFTDPKTPKTVRWLRWLGAVFSEREDGLLDFRIERKHGC